MLVPVTTLVIVSLVLPIDPQSQTVIVMFTISKPSSKTNFSVKSVMSDVVNVPMSSIGVTTVLLTHTEPEHQDVIVQMDSSINVVKTNTLMVDKKYLTDSAPLKSEPKLNA